MELIFKNEKEIKRIENKYNNYANILNQNAAKIIAYNESFNNKDFILYSLQWDYYRVQIYNIIGDIVKRKTIFFSHELVTDIFRETEHKLLHNEYIREGLTLIPSDYNKQAMNIKQSNISNEEMDNLKRILDYNYTTHTFSVNAAELQKEIDKHIFYTKSKKQEKILKAVKEFNKACKDLWDLDICAYNYLNPYKDVTEIEMDELLAKDILSK